MSEYEISALRRRLEQTEYALSSLQGSIDHLSRMIEDHIPRLVHVVGLLTRPDCETFGDLLADKISGASKP